MPCLNIDITNLSPQFNLSVTRQGRLSASIINLVEPITTSITRRDGLQGVELRDTTSRLKVDFGVVCNVGGDYILRFEQAVLTWNADDVGVIKYNTLFASGEWSLEEIEIEELL